jgi:two-component system, NarL family, response regulator NreC
MDKIRVLLADDHAVLRAGLRLLINTQPDMEVVGEAANGHEAVRRTLETSPDVAIVDLTMPEGGGIQAIEQIRQKCPDTRVLVLTMHDDTAYLRSALAAGVSGYVVKKSADSELISAIQAVYRGHMFVDLASSSNAIQDALVDKEGKPSLGQPDAKGFLSQREKEVLHLLAQGYTNQQVADRLCLSVKTIETYRSRLAEKLELKTRADIVRYALELGLIGPGKVALENELPNDQRSI